MEGTLAGTTTLGQSEPGSNCNKGVLHPYFLKAPELELTIRWFSVIQDTWWGGLTPSAEMQLAYSIAPTN